jgi:hypothetical protein
MLSQIKFGQGWEQKKRVSDSILKKHAPEKLIQKT